MKIFGGSVFGTDHKMHNVDLCFENGIITNESKSGQFDATDCYVLPGLIDTHIHGAFGVVYYFSDADMVPSLDWLSRHGVTGILASTATETPEELVHDIRRIANTKDSRIVGIHAEGPFINPVNMGGMHGDRIQKPNVEILKMMYEASKGKLKILTMAPEMEDADKVIECCNELGIKVSIGHSSATYDEAKKAVDKGACRATHTFNAMRGYNHREPGILGLALDDDRVSCELICDLYHVSAPAIKLAVKVKGIENITMISDCGMFTGMGDGDYVIGDHTIYVHNGLCLLENGTICGSSKCLSVGVKNMFELGYKPEEIAVMAAVNPAKACGCTDRGELQLGYRADIVVFDKSFDIKAVFLGGERIR